MDRRRNQRNDIWRCNQTIYKLNKIRLPTVHTYRVKRVGQCEFGQSVLDEKYVFNENENNVFM